MAWLEVTEMTNKSYTFNHDQDENQVDVRHNRKRPANTYMRGVLMIETSDKERLSIWPRTAMPNLADESVRPGETTAKRM